MYALYGSSLDTLFFFMYSGGFFPFRYFLTVGLLIPISFEMSIMDVPMSLCSLIKCHTSASNNQITTFVMESGKN